MELIVSQHLYPYLSNANEKALYARAVDGNAGYSDTVYSAFLSYAESPRSENPRAAPERGHSQEAFADVSGFHRTFMGTVERGESNVSFTNMAKIAAALKVPLQSWLPASMSSHG
ncbi:hypothetical protein ACPOL_6782 (plasmid) [Acidisarcina polymorpha]|uniref:HTH cro/C1-type domain-containing protein n=2 Tax=Acidisarcina polymorpha TaxID=2211140 RepID=A0A2Z5G9N2_9BACT|nr:hypothetical protein ACPOL_6782 [Acidisarcina polymorpha]